MSSTGDNHNEKLFRTLFGILVAVFLLVIVLTFRDYGVGWDERVHSVYGELVVKYFTSGFKDTRCNGFLDLQLYGPLFDSLCSLIYKNFDVPKYETRHLCTALIAVLTLFGVFRLGRTYFGTAAGFFTTLILLMLPRFYGHGFINSKDIPYACAFVWSMIAIFRLLKHNKPAWKDFALCGLTIGLTLAVRAGGVLLVAYLAAGIVFRALTCGPGKQRWPGIGCTVAGGLLMVGISWIVMIAFWPWMHDNPFANPVKAFQAMTDFHYTYPVLFEGTLQSSDNLPWYYLPKTLTLTTPPAIIALFIVGLGIAACSIFTGFRTSQTMYYCMVLLWFFFPILYIIVNKPNIYDGIRHFIFILPAMALMCGVAAATCYNVLAEKLQRPLLALAFMIAVVLMPARDLLLLHPYQMTYFNFGAGGVGGAWQNYETDYWTTSYREAAGRLNRRAIAEPGEEMVVVLAANFYSRVCAEYYLAPNVTVYPRFTGKEPLPPEFDYYVSTTRYKLHERFPDLPVVHTIGRQGAIFCVIKDGKKQKPE